MDSFYKKNKFNAIAWSHSVVSIDQIYHSFFGFDIVKNHSKLISILKAI